jgi:uncharacterized membrane protein YdbT with pleckstrin-like domain
MEASSKELHERYEATAKDFRDCLAILPKLLHPHSGADTAKVAVATAGTSLEHAEAVVAMLLDAVERYTEAAAADRESQEKNRQAEALAREAREKELHERSTLDDKHMAAQRRQGNIMIVFTAAIALATIVAAFSTAWTAWRSARQSERMAAPVTSTPLQVFPQGDAQ